MSTVGDIEKKRVRVLRVSGKESGRSDITMFFFFFFFLRQVGKLRVGVLEY